MSRIDTIHGRHFVQTGEEARLPKRLMADAIDEMVGTAERAINAVAEALPHRFPAQIHDAVSAGIRSRLASLRERA